MFIDQEYLENRWGQERVERLAEEAAGPGGDAAAAIADAISSAESFAVSLLRPRYGDQLPADEASTPDVLKQQVADLAIYHLARHHSLIGEEIARAYQDAQSFLRLVARGHADLGLATAPPVDRSDLRVLASHTVEDMVFGHGGLDEW